MAKRAATLLVAIEAERAVEAAALRTLEAKQTAEAKQAARAATARRVKRSVPAKILAEIWWFVASIAATLIAIVVLNVLLNPGSDFSIRVMALWGGLIGR